MSALPKVFISATSGDLRSIRQIVKEALLTINCHPVEQTNFEPDWRTVEGMLRGKIADCQALIHIAGLRYGAEPDPATLPPGTPRRSHTQMEYQIGCQLHEERGDTGFRVYTFVCPATFPYDPAPDVEPEEKRTLQRQHRAALIDNPRLYEQPTGRDDLRLRILALQEQVLSLQHQQIEVQKEVRRSSKTILTVLALVLLLLVGVFGVQMWMHRDIATLNTIDTARIKTHLRESSEHKLAEDLALAEKEKKSDDRQRLKDAATAAHQARLARIDDLATSFAVLDGQADASPILREMTRILAGEGVDAALRYIDGQRGALLAAEAARDATHLEEKRARLQPLLKAAGLQATKGQSTAARSSYEDLLQSDPFWPEALGNYAWFLFDQSVQSKYHGTLKEALVDARQCLAVAQRFHDFDPAISRAQRVLFAANSQMGDVLVLRGAEGDAGQIIQHYHQSLALAQTLYKTKPDSAQAGRDVSLSLEKLGNFLNVRGQPGDAEQALEYYTRSLEVSEKLLAAKPDSVQAGRDVSGSLEKLGAFLTVRGQPGDAELSLKHFTRSLEMREKLLVTNPDSVQVGRDVSIGLNKLGDFLSGRGQPGDMEQALKYYTRSLESREKLLAAKPDSAQAARDVSGSLERVGFALSKRNNPDDIEKATQYFALSHKIFEDLWKANPNSASAASDLADICKEYGDHCERTKTGDARGWWQKAYDILNAKEQKGMLLSPSDKKALEELRGKIK